MGWPGLRRPGRAQAARLHLERRASLRDAEDNIERLQALLADVDLLHIECVFAEGEREHALRKNHLTASQAGEIARRLRAKRVVPFHFSPRYRGRERKLREELDAAWAAPGNVPG